MEQTRIYNGVPVMLIQGGGCCHPCESCIGGEAGEACTNEEVLGKACLEGYGMIWVEDEERKLLARIKELEEELELERACSAGLVASAERWMREYYLVKEQLDMLKEVYNART